MKHKVFFWLLLVNRLNTRGLLQRRGMILDSYTCDLCILQLPETNAHLFLHCNFAKACWNSFGVNYPSSATVLQIFEKIKKDLALPFFMEIIILLAWSIGKLGTAGFSTISILRYSVVGEYLRRNSLWCF
jgi:hypothetical protein